MEEGGTFMKSYPEMTKTELEAQHKELAAAYDRLIAK